MPRFKVYNYDQNAMVVINYQDQLPGSALAWQKRKGLKHFSEWRRKSLSKQSNGSRPVKNGISWWLAICRIKTSRRYYHES
jgi:hypothetical protein